MPEYDIVIKNIDPILVASIRDVIPNYPEQGHLWTELESFLRHHQITPTGPCFTIYYSEEPDVDTEVCEPVGELPPPDNRIRTHELPGVPSMATVIHKGPFLTIGEAYTAMLKWIEANDFQISGPPREVYLNPADKGSQTDPETITEIQFPIDKD